MPIPIALCLEQIDTDDESERYLMCVAIAGSDPGLTLDDSGVVSWKDDPIAPACELWVSLDEQLILFRPELTGADPIHLHRGGRSLEIPAGKPVVVLDQDELELGGRRLRLHVHGEAPAIHGPRYFVDEPVPEDPPSRTAQVAVTALAIGAAMGAAGCTKKKIEVRDKPPKVEYPAPDASTVQPDTKPPVDLLAPDKKPTTKSQAKKPVEVRVRPPRVARPPTPKQKLAPLDKPTPKKKTTK